MFMKMSSDLWINVLREIGEDLLKEIPSMAGGTDASIFLRRGASGDKTFFIDKVAEDIVIKHLETLREKGYGFTLVSEECGIRRFGEESNTYVLLDPLDGSNNAKRGVPYFSTSIAILEGDRLEDIVLGYVIDLPSGIEYWAVRGGGAWCDGARINCRKGEDIDMVAFEASVPSRDIYRLLPLLKSARKVRCLGSIALDLALMATGAVDILAIATPSRSFDFASGMLILQEAGGLITDTEGNDIGGIKASLGRTVSLIAAANQALHQKALTLLA